MTVNYGAIKELVDRYNELERSGEIKKYNESTTRTKFIEPLFEALGWNIRGIKKSEDEVTEEEKISKGRVDYGFWLNGVPKFYLEAKSLKEEEIIFGKGYDKQAINYSWLKSCSWAVLTNFRTLAVYNADKPNGEWFFTIHAKDFLQGDRERLELLSKEAFKQNKMDKKALEWGKKLIKNPINKLLLQDMIHFREVLSKDIKRNNQDKNLTQEDIDEAVQRILDRLIFIRNAEDRELEENQLQSNVRQWYSRGRGHLIKEISRIYKDYDDKYNSKLFSQDKCDDLNIENEALQEVIEGLNHSKDNSYRYDFSVIESDVLGKMYEQYLSNILKSAPKRAKLEESKTHRKEQGIYYTPSYIVDYIVKNTVGEYIKTHKPEEIRKVRILDPACGSGSFLIRAYKELENYWNKQYGTQETLKFDEGEKFYTRKVEILKNNIFGVDLDPKAVEIAQLNLLLQISEKGEKLPLLQNNIKVGNSLIDDLSVSDKAFKWEDEFPEIMREDGFDIVIGNPPWSSKISNDLNKVATKKYALSNKNINICSLFILSALEKLKTNGIFGFLLPKVLIKNEAYQPIRGKILNNCRILQIVDFGQFPGVASDAIGLIIQNEKKSDMVKIAFFEGEKLIKNNSINQGLFSKNASAVFSIMINNTIQKLIDKIISNSSELGSILKIKRGIELGQKSYIIKCPKCGTYNEAITKYYGHEEKTCKVCGNKLVVDIKNVIQISSTKKQNDYEQECIAGSQLKRYEIACKYYIKTGLKGIDYKLDAFAPPKILVKRIATKIEGTFSNDKLLAFNTVYSIYGNNYTKERLLSILGILNSKLIEFFYEFSYNIGMNLTTQITIDFLSKIPIKEGNAIQNKRLANLVAEMISLKEQLNEGANIDSKIRSKEKEDNINKEINDLVCKIYNITDEEKKIIEENLK